MTTARTVRADRASSTQEAILKAAERLYAEHGVFAVSNRQVSEAAGQGNNTAVGYHFGTKTDLVRAIIRKHMERIDGFRVERLEGIGEEPTMRDWVACFILPTTDHLGSLGGTTWFARFAAQVFTDPALRLVIADEAMSAAALRRVTDGLDRCLPDLPPQVREERDEMVTQLALVTPAVREAAVASGAPTARDTWNEAGLGLVDAIVGLYQAEYTEAEG